MAALAVPATPAITASATRADRMVFMAISPMLWPIPRSRGQEQLFHSLIGAAVTEGTTIAAIPQLSFKLPAVGLSGPAKDQVRESCLTKWNDLWGIVFRADLGSGVRYERECISLRRRRGVEGFCTQPNAEVRTLVNALEYQWRAGCPWGIHNVR